MREKLNELKEYLNELADLLAVINLLNWDQLVNMPEGAADDRGVQMATIESILHQKGTSDELGALLEDLRPYADQLDKDDEDACLIRVSQREFDKQTKVPAEFVTEFARVSTVAQTVWANAKQNSDFQMFLPHLQQLVEMRRQYADFFKPWQHVYDPLIDDFEPGMKTAQVQEIFNKLRPQQVNLIKEILDQPPINRDFLFLDYPVNEQRIFSQEVVTQFGYDWKHGRLDESPHPFTITFGLNDVRITNRYSTDYLPSALFGSMHECGHALYEMGIDKKFNRTPLGNSASMAVHESQSRLWENLIGRSWPFWKRFYPRLQELFSTQLGSVDFSDFFHAVNAVEATLIRVEADEATYNLHIMLRLELEIALMEGSLEVKDAPQAWNEKVKEYLGVSPTKDENGILQDVHWSFGGFGYFPTYALGNLVSAQIWEKMEEDIPDRETLIENGKFGEILAWLGEKVHVHGAKYEPQELVERITGSPINPDAYLRYLNKKFRDIYKLS